MLCSTHQHPHASSQQAATPAGHRVPVEAAQVGGVRVSSTSSATPGAGGGTSPATPAGGALGKTAKTVRQAPKNSRVPAHLHFGDTPAQETRKRRFKHQRSAASLLPGSRTAQCLWALASNSCGVDVIHSPSEQRARFGGLQTCGSVWACPCCSARVSEQRRLELNDALMMARHLGYAPVLITLTTRHKRGDALAALLESLKKAKQRWARHRSFTALRSKNGGSLVGYVTATEVVGGGQHGWHPHFHVLAFFNVDTEKKAMEAAETLRSSWMASLNAEGLDGNGAAFHVQGAAQAGAYVTKWGAGEELALQDRKQGRGDGRTPFQLLADYSDQDDTRAGELFREYATVFHGARQLVWSPGLKDLFGIAELSDERIAEEEAKRAEEADSEAVVGHFTPIGWRAVRSQRHTILKMAETAGALGVLAAERAIKSWAAQQNAQPVARGGSQQGAGGSPKGGAVAGQCNLCPAPGATGQPQPSHAASA